VVRRRERRHSGCAGHTRTESMASVHLGSVHWRTYATIQCRGAITAWLNLDKLYEQCMHVRRGHLLKDDSLVECVQHLFGVHIRIDWRLLREKAVCKVREQIIIEQECVSLPEGITLTSEYW
jgi:hypothetical protein